MRKQTDVWLCILLAVFGSASALAQPRLVVEKPNSYQVGDVVESDVFVLDRDLQRRSLISLIKPETKVVALVMFGGAALKTPDVHRGPLWCEDSFDDLAVERALVAEFERSAVQFLAVAVPPVYNPPRYGYADKAFLGYSETSPEFLDAAQRFVESTEAQVKKSLLPFTDVYYDPRYRLAGKLKTGEGGESEADRYPWEGKLRWPEDPRNYGLPIIWLLGPKGEILQPPFFGNDWDSEPPHVQYEFRDLKAAIEKYLPKE